MKVFVKGVYCDNRGKKYINGWEKLRFDNEIVGKWYIREMVKKGEIVEFFGFGWYGVRSVEGWLWVEEEKVCVEKLGLCE